MAVAIAEKYELRRASYEAFGHAPHIGLSPDGLEELVRRLQQ